MPRVPLSSRTLASASYDPDRCQLELEFRSGKRYLYFQVPRHCYEEFLQAESKGGYFNRSIRNQFAFQDLSAPFAPIVLTASQN
ncbi:MAG TPA: KTSC domain-containing protein [Terriglobales bacterium]|nr:KTSC domain-containing protein [Terriglobales bacterium]